MLPNVEEIIDLSNKTAMTRSYMLAELDFVGHLSKDDAH